MLPENNEISLPCVVENDKENIKTSKCNKRPISSQLKSVTNQNYLFLLKLL